MVLELDRQTEYQVSAFARFYILIPACIDACFDNPMIDMITVSCLPSGLCKFPSIRNMQQSKSRVHQVQFSCLLKYSPTVLYRQE